MESAQVINEGSKVSDAIAKIQSWEITWTPALTGATVPLMQ
jgi:hypothetical protein